MYFISFFLPLIIMIAIFAVRGIYPFGDNVYLRSDMYHQYCPFFSELWDKIRNGGSLFYSWEIGLGSNFSALYCKALQRAQYNGINFWYVLCTFRFHGSIQLEPHVVRLHASASTGAFRA